MASNGDLTRAVETSSYKQASDERLRELIAAALDIHGNNVIALHRITNAAEILRQELERREAERREQAAVARHREIEGRLNELKRPHWTVLPNFWITVAAAIAAVTATIVAWLAWKRPVAPAVPPPVATAKP